MATDRTVQPMTPNGLGLLPRRGLITRRPGAGGPVPLIVGAVIVAVSVLYFVQSLQVDRSTFTFGLDEMTERWNGAASAADAPLLTIDTPTPRLDESGDLIFAHAWSEELSLRGRIDPDSSNLVELTVIGDPEVVGPDLIVDAMELLIRVTEPDLGAQGRLQTLQELGVVGGDPTADLRATRGGTDYVVAGSSASSEVGMSAAPYSDFTTRPD
jgi:hypothetical protein